MLFHPQQQRLEIVPGTRQVYDVFGLTAFSFTHKELIWQIAGLFAPVAGRALGGFRTRIVNQWGIWSFINQRDLEILLGDATPGQWCHWLGKRYPDPEDSDWYGPCLDELDLEDDLQMRELEIRQQFPCMPDGLSIERNMHTDGSDYTENLSLLWDRGPDGISPDFRLETIGYRWRRVERRKIEWR